jgi:hypothetical protein
VAHVEVVGDRLVIRLDWTDRLWAFKSQLELPLEHVAGVEVDPEQARISRTGLPVRERGSWLPGMIAAGSVREQDGWAFWDVQDPDHAVIIKLADERYARLVVEVDDPGATAAELRRTILDRRRPAEG